MKQLLQNKLLNTIIKILIFRGMFVVSSIVFLMKNRNCIPSFCKFQGLFAANRRDCANAVKLDNRKR